MGVVEVDPGEPHNDQMLAYTKDDLADHMEAVRKMLAGIQDVKPPLAACVAALAIHLIDDTENMPRERMASLLALSLIQAADTHGDS